MLEVEDASKSFGATAALKNLSFSLKQGEIVGLVGANGAGKSTLIRLISGLLTPDTGRLSVDGAEVALSGYSRNAAQAMGIRTVFQELSLCTRQTVLETFFIEQPQLAPRFGFRRKLRAAAADNIEQVFPGTKIPLDVPVGRLSIAERQIIEIARAASAPMLKLLILDEPTSSLDARQSDQLLSYVRNRANQGVSFIFVTHKLREIIDVATRIVAMRNGSLVLDRPSHELSLATLVQTMGGSAEITTLHARTADAASAGDAAKTAVFVTIGSDDPTNGLGRPIPLHAGEIVGIAGLEGNGQKKLLRRVYFDQRLVAGTTFPPRGKVGFVSGDRAHEGTFTGLSILSNATIRRVAQLPLFTWLSPQHDEIWAGGLLADLGVSPDRFHLPIRNFSGGNQQKALMARPLVAQNSVVLLDDPTRGVDISTKQQIYKLIRDGSDAGCLFLWVSSENLEYSECDRVLIMHDGKIVEELDRDSVSDQRLVSSSFRATGSRSEANRKESRGRWIIRTTDPAVALPYILLILAYSLIALNNAGATSAFGIDLILSAAVPLILASIAQMFIVSGSQIDLGVGTFASLANVISGVFLPTQPLIGTGLLVFMLVAYCGAGAMIALRRIPSIVVTLGASFIWLGEAHALLPTPGGTAPSWIIAAFSVSVFGIPPSLVTIVLLAIIGSVIIRSRFGVVMRGFGDNETAMEQAGWSVVRNQLLRYLLSGCFAIGAGFAMTALSGGADANSGGTLTLLSVAALVIGGCSLVGGEVSAVGTVAGAIVVSLVGYLLGTYGVSTNYSAAVQGSFLLIILTLKTLRWRTRS
jgi:ribose transport system ATP-binding protein